MTLLPFAAMTFVTHADFSLASGKIYYGSRTGMTVTVISVSGLNTKKSIIKTKHMRDDAISFCKDYVGKVTDSCVNDELSRPLNDVISANCINGTFNNFWGEKLKYEGKNTNNKNISANYLINNLSESKYMDGSSASGYGVALGIFQALCPSRAPSDG